MRRRAFLAIAAGMVAVTALAGCAPAPRPRAGAIPESLQNLAYSRCVNRLDPTTTTDYSVSIGGEGGNSSCVDVGPLTAVDADGNRSTTWHVHVTPGRVALESDAEGAPVPADAELARVQKVGRSLFDCVSEYRFQPPAEFPSSRAALLQLFRYDVGVLWPCLTAHGVVLGPAPSRRSYLSQADAYAAYPVPLSGSPGDVTRMLSAAAACPAIPPYLRDR